MAERGYQIGVLLHAALVGAHHVRLRLGVHDYILRLDLGQELAPGDVPLAADALPHIEVNEVEVVRLS
ncbi:hypothetical protein D3C83_222720 [compost metagenome]